MVRGVVLIVVAVALGIVLLQATEGPDPFEVPPDELTGGASTVTTATGQASTTATTLAPVDPSTITVLVANGGGIAGLAAAVTDQVAAEGYQTADPTNAEQVDASVVYYTPGFEGAAETLAALFDPAPAVAPLPDPPPVDDLEAANLVLVAAADLAP
ncbi:MAG: LytR C-terminal domain-containing protein [Actinobacteria bacterium]|nr:LytR C-terminal domain-containing protein [Actinomycetota bacterium]MBW3643782.1 LytR C-terminal domain-containing protein [Actinomycetota bacterium]